MAKTKHNKGSSTARSIERAPDRGQSLAAVNLKELAVAELILLVAGARSVISQLTLSPVYGSLPASRYHAHSLICTWLATLLFRPETRRRITTTLGRWLPLLAWTAIPTQHYLCRLSGVLGPVYGPVVTEGCAHIPVLLLSLLVTGDILGSHLLKTLSSNVTRLVVLLASIATFSLGRLVLSKIVPSLIGTSLFFTRYSLDIAVASSYTVLAPTSAILPCVIPILWVLLFDPHRSPSNLPPWTGRWLDEYNYTLLERKDSLTGYISVLESHNDDFRVLRCDHSLLGGDWLVTERSRKRGLRRRETVYSVFTMLEAVRLVERAAPVIDRDSSALFIGLGIGTSPKAFIEHGINTTIVELDPVVHAFAMKYFELPSKHQAYLQDAVSFVSRFGSSQPASYDYIIHDVFTGGAEPTALFTLEFLQGLGRLLKDDGVIAINYAADLSLPVPRIIIRTVLAVFPTCRVYRDTPPEEAGAGGSFINMVVFCTKSSNSNINFRDGTEADWLGSLSRRQWIPPKTDLEISITDFVTAKDRADDSRILRRGHEVRVEKYHQVSAERHWRIMRTVLPDAVWELW